MRTRLYIRLALLVAAFAVMLLGGRVIGFTAVIGGVVLVLVFLMLQQSGQPDTRLAPPPNSPAELDVTERWHGMTRNEEDLLTANRSGRVAAQTGNIRPLLKDLRGKNLFKASSAARQLGRMRNPAASPHLSLAARQGDSRLRSDSIAALARIATPETYNVLAALMDENPDIFGPDILQAVEGSSGPRVDELLRTACERGDWYLRSLAERRAEGDS